MKDKLAYTEEQFDSNGIFILKIGLIIGFFLGILGTLIFLIITGADYYDEMEELGQSICEEEYNMDFVSYNSDEGLRCKEISANYDGLKVRFGEIKNAKRR